MKRYVLTSAAVAAMAVGGVARAAAAGPATMPAGDLVEVDPALEGQGSVAGLVTKNVRVKLAPRAGVPTSDDFRIALERLRWRIPSQPDVVWRVGPGAFSPLGDAGTLSYVVETPSGLAVGIGGALGPQDVEKSNQVFVRGLRAMLTADGPMTGDQRRRRVTEIESELGRVREMEEALKALAMARPSRAEAVGKRVEALRAEEQRLGMELAAKEARRMALQRAIDMRRTQAANDRQNDPVLEQLRAVQKLRENEVQRLEAMVRHGTAPSSDLEESQARLAEARMKVAEREAEVGKAGKGELLDRMADELAMVAVDQAELQIQSDAVRRQLQMLNPAVATTQSLEDALKTGLVPPAAGAAGLPPLYGELERHERELVREKVVLQVEDVEEVK